MPTYLVETYLADPDGRDGPAAVRWARGVADDVRRQATGLRIVRSIQVPEDELCFILLEAPSSSDAATAARRAGLEPLRVVAAITSDESAPEPQQTPRGD